MRTLADFRRAAVTGSHWKVVNHKRPAVSGNRTITKAQTNRLRYDYTLADGSTGTDSWLDIPKANEVRVDGDSVHFLDTDGTVAFTWTRDGDG